MGRVKELIIELAETFEDLRPSRSTWQAAIDAMNEILSPDEFEFFLDHIEDVKTIIGMHGDDYPTNESLEMPPLSEWVNEYSSFRQREMNAGVEDEDPDQQREMVRRLQNKYYKLRDGGYVPALYHTPDMGPVDGKTYMKNRKTGGYFPVKG